MCVCHLGSICAAQRNGIGWRLKSTGLWKNQLIRYKKLTWHFSQMPYWPSSKMDGLFIPEEGHSIWLKHEINFLHQISWFFDKPVLFRRTINLSFCLMCVITPLCVPVISLVSAWLVLWANCFCWQWIWLMCWFIQSGGYVVVVQVISCI